MEPPRKPPVSDHLKSQPWVVTFRLAFIWHSVFSYISYFSWLIMQRVLKSENGFIASRWGFRCRCSIKLLVSWLWCPKLRNNILGTVRLFYYLFALCCLLDFWSQLRCTYAYMLFIDFLSNLLYLVIQINVVHATMLKSTDDVLQKPLKIN